MKQIEDRLLDMKASLDAMEQFNPELMMKEVHEITESLYKLRAGRFITEDMVSLEDQYYEQDHYGDEDYEEFEEDYYDKAPYQGKK